jgi:hypothetical protein
VAHWPVSAVVLTFGVGSVALAWREIARRPEGRHG